MEGIHRNTDQPPNSKQLNEIRQQEQTGQLDVQHRRLFFTSTPLLLAFTPSMLVFVPSTGFVPSVIIPIIVRQRCVLLLNLRPITRNVPVSASRRRGCQRSSSSSLRSSGSRPGIQSCGVQSTLFSDSSGHSECGSFTPPTNSIDHSLPSLAFKRFSPSYSSTARS
ncbi:hypothetical protein B0H13DRAFT_964935 [Mycena leptocephala]|nr:hypothetical protein B0H13DRAFT_964935 [Mycena leptocephala]